jgi:signal transduction histidine kinase
MLYDAIAGLSGHLLGVSPEDACSGIGSALQTLGEVLPAERTSLFLISEGGDRFDRLQQWCSPSLVARVGENSLASRSTSLTGVRSSTRSTNPLGWTSLEMPWLFEQLSKQEPLAVSRLSQLPPEAGAERCLWAARGLGSVIIVPMVSGGVLLGALEIEALGRERAWPQESLPLLRIAVDAMASLLERSRASESLRASRERLRESEQFGVLGRLAGGVAHDFNNFLTAIIGYSHLLSSGLDEESPCQEDVAEIRHAADRASALVDKILSFGGSRKREPAQIDPSQGVAEMTKILRRIAGDAVEIETDLADSPYRIRIDPSQFDQLLVNLTANARDAMPDGGTLRIVTDFVELCPGGVCRGAQVSAPEGLAPGRYALLTVSDTGCGMDETVAEDIFEAFYTTKAPGEGTGWGLATISGIVSEAGGAIGLETAPGVGTTFRIFLPAVRPEVGLLVGPEAASLGQTVSPAPDVLCG